ncbi:transposase [Methylobacterium brachiatum]
MADQKQTFTPEFCAVAVRLAQTSGRSRREAADLGVGLSTLMVVHFISFFEWVDSATASERSTSSGQLPNIKFYGFPAHCC